MRSNGIRVAIAGVGNCASTLVQGVSFYSKNPDASGLMFALLGKFRPEAIEFVAAFDIDVRKVGKALGEAIFAPPNNALRVESDTTYAKVVVSKGPCFDGVASHRLTGDSDFCIEISSHDPVDVASILRSVKADVLVCYLPVGSTQAVGYYADAALKAKVALVNCVPVPIANNSDYSNKFMVAGVPLIGDDIRSQVGATIVHQALLDLLRTRGYVVEKTYQLNYGGNADFFNMLDRTRLADKKRSKTGAVLAFMNSVPEEVNVHIGPSDFVAQLRDTKIAQIHIDAQGFAGSPLTIDLRLEVQDSPNSAGVVIDAIRCAAIAKELGIGGVLDCASSYYMKSPPNRLSDIDAVEGLKQLGLRHRDRDRDCGVLT